MTAQNDSGTNDQASQSAATSSNETTPQAGTPSQQSSTATTTPAAPQAGTDQNQQNSATGDNLTEADLRKMVADLRKEAAGYRTKAKELDDLKRQAEEAKLSELEKAQKAAKDLEAQASAYKQRLASYAVQLEAQKLGIVDPEVAAVLIAGQLEYGDDGTPTNAAKLLADLVKAKPYLVQSAEPAQSAQPTAPRGGMPANPSRTANANAQPPKTLSQMARFGTGQDIFKR